MNINSIQFENFINQFYSNNSNQKMVLTLDVDNSSDPNIYDIHTMLLDLLCKGIERFNLNIYNNLQLSINQLQIFFTNINIQIDVQNYSKHDLIANSDLYSNRYIKFTAENPSLMVINGTHKIADNLLQIKSFYLINDTYNLCISFNFIV